MYNGQVMLDVMLDAQYIVMRHREWFAREVRLAEYHPYIKKAIEMFRPDDWHDLLLQWPHQSDNHPSDFSKLAYTRDERAGLANRQTVTSLGKYLRAHFSTMPDDAIRDLVALAQSTMSNFKIVRTTVEMIYHLNQGPSSCMQWEDGYGVKGEDGDKHHPYETYCPSLGWHMAVRLEGGDTVGRALCMDDGKAKFFVRSYKKTSGYSGSDEQLEMWLKEQGYHRRSDWEDCRLKIIPARNDCGFVAPYLDGDCKHVTRSGNTLRIVEDGDYKCDNTDGTADENGEPCSDCGDRVEEGDGYWVGRYDDRLVCESCCSADYTFALGCRGERYYVSNDNTVWVESQDEHYHDDYLDENNIIELANGDYEHEDNAVEVDGDYYHFEDDRIVRCVDDDEYHLKADAYYHEDSDEWYADEDSMPKSDDDTDATDTE